MPPKASTASAANAPATRSSTRTKPSTSSALAAPTTAPVRSTRSTRAVSTTVSSAAPSRTRAAAAPSVPPAEPVRKLRPVSERNTASSKSVKAQDSKGPAAMLLAATKKALKPIAAGKQEDREPIKAFLRVRPDLSNDGSSNAPYLTLISETEVQMSPPPSISVGFTNIRIPNPSTRRQTFSFSKVFPSDTAQSPFFSNTTLPLVKDLLNGENGLIFAYGVTNSGKTYTIQGKNDPEQAGLLPRTLDVIFNSLDGHLDRSEETTDTISQESLNGTSSGEDSFVKGLLSESEQSQWLDRDASVVPADPDYEYRVFISYAEIYNNQIFDLLGKASEAPTRSGLTPSSSNSNMTGNPAAIRGTFLPTSLSSLSIFSWMGSSSTPAGSRNVTPINPTTTLTRQALSLRSDPASGTKYIANLREIQVNNANDAKRIVRIGQVNRKVFGTVANKESSRSHAVFTIRIERVHKDRKDAVESARLSIVDLAGSERNKNTQATGDRMDEANKINSSLMVLGQCMRILRSNQKKLAKAAASGSQRSVRTEIPPYRLSKLTELFQEFFEGSGRAVMIVNVNPFDTGYQENTAVMEFSALASEISTITTKLQPRIRPTKTSSTPEPLEQPAGKSKFRQVRLSVAGPSGSEPVERVFDIVEEDEDAVEDDDDLEEDDTLVSRLFEELDMMRQRWYDAEIRCAMIEAETRESVMQEMEERMQLMERMHAQRLRQETEDHELKMDRKIEMLSRTGAFGDDESDEERGDVSTEDGEEMNDVEASLIIPDRESTISPTPIGASRGVRIFLDDEEESSTTVDTGKNTDEMVSRRVGSEAALGQSSVPVPPILPDAPPLSDPDEKGEDEDAGSEDEDDNDSSIDEEDDTEGASDAEWLPSGPSIAPPSASPERESPRRKTRVSSVASRSPSKSRSTSALPPEEFSSANEDDTDTEDAPAPIVAKTKGKTVKELKPPKLLSADDSLDEPVIVPNRKARLEAQENLGERGTYVPDVGEPGAVKKKKRHLGGKGVLTEDDIIQVAMKVDSGSGQINKGSVRRLNRSSR